MTVPAPRSSPSPAGVVLFALLGCAFSACTEPPAAAQPDAGSPAPVPPAPAAVAAPAQAAAGPDLPLAPAAPVDYEKFARKLYASQPDYERKWPIEFHIRVLEGLTQDMERAARDLGAGLGPPLFAEKVTFSLPGPGPAAPLWGPITDESWVPAPPEDLPVAGVQSRLSAFLHGFRFLEQVTIKLKLGKVPAPGRFEGTASIEFAGLGTDGKFRRDGGKAELAFTKLHGFWRCDRFVVKELRTQRAAEKLLLEASDSWLAGAGPEVRNLLRVRSASDDFSDAHLQPEALLHAPLGKGSTAFHPGVTVVDVNADGFDDLFVWDILGETVLLENDQGRGFRDRTDAYGLRFRDVSAPAFADLNNDGHPDLVLGRWTGPSELYVWEQGRYLPSWANRYYSFPSNVAAVSFADVDLDGWLDIYFSTSAGDFHHRLAQILSEVEAKGSVFDPTRIPISRLEFGYISAALQLAGSEKAAGRFEANVYRFGPPNLFFRNTGGWHFVDETQARGLVLFRDSLAASFADFDGDGRPDLVVANDFAPASIYLNRGDGFEDVSVASGASRSFFGMGTSVGDFDADGDQDVYLTSMSSSAGHRILTDPGNFSESYGEADRTARLDSIRGNTLLRNDGKGHFTDATAEPAFAPARPANWAYSAQFIDLDGDGYLDVLSPNGFVTARRPLSDPYIRDL